MRGDKSLKELTDSDIDGMTKHELVRRLATVNPLGGYTVRDRRRMLTKTLKRWRDRS